MSTPLAAEYVVEQLVRWGIDTFFVLTGGAIAPFIDAISRNPRAKYYCFQHEQAASMAADGYFRASGKVACVAVTSGPGAQNIMNGLCGCWYDSVPALFITGQVNVKESLDSVTCKPRQIGFQETPVVDCFRPFTKHIAKLSTIDDVASNLLASMQAALSGRKGPVLLDFPVSTQMTPLDAEPAYVALEAPRLGTEVPPSAKDLVTSLLASAERPVVVLGDGARDAKLAALAFVEGAGVPVALAWGGFDLLPSALPLNLGTIGVYGDRVANFAVQNADLIISIGARLDTRQTGGNLSLFSKASTKLVVDIDENEIQRLQQRGVKVAHKFACDAGAFLSACMPAASVVSRDKLAPWLAKITEWQTLFGNECRPSVPGFVSPYSFLSSLKLPANAVIAIDTGATLVWAFQSLRPIAGQRIFSNLGNSSMGYALPAAIGAAIGAPDRPTFCVIGDGGMQQNVQELATALRYKLDVRAIVINNAGYGIIQGFQNAYLHRRHVATSTDEIYGSEGVDFAALASAYRVRALRVTGETAAEEVDNVLLAEPGPVVLDVIVHPEHGIQPKVEFGNSLDSMAPFVDSENHMIIPPAPRVQAGGWKRV